MLSNYRVIVLTSDKYLFALKTFAWLFNKYWNTEQKVLVGGFSSPDKLPKNFTFHSIGRYEDYPIGKWTDALIKLLHEIDDEVFVLMLEDYWLTRQVNTQGVQMCVDYCRQFKYTLRLDLTTDRLFSEGAKYPSDIADYGSLGYLDLVKSNPESQYHMSLMTAVWRRDKLLDILIPNESPWDLEMAGTVRARMKANELLVLGTRQWLVRHTLGLRGGDVNSVNTKDLLTSDAEELKQLGYL